MYDLLIRNGTVVDGTGLSRYRADVAVKDGRIATIGRLRGAAARQELNAEGHVVTPGFIDGHTHMDAQVFWDPLGASSCWQGVTSVVMGNCGFTLAPASREQRQLVVRNLERAEDISGAAMEAGIDWRWSTFREYMDAVDRLPKGINYAANIGHSALRTWTMGEAAFERHATDDELRAMEHELTDALAAGAVGLTTSRSEGHSTSDDRPVASRIGSWEEVRRLAIAMGRCSQDHGSQGIFEISLPFGARSADPQERRGFFEQLIALSLDAGVLVTWGILPQTRLGMEECRLLDEAAAYGARMMGQTHSRGIAIVRSFKTQMPYDWMPEWQAVRKKPFVEQKRLLQQPEVRARLVQATKTAAFPKEAGAGVPRKPDFSNFFVMQSALPPNPSVAQLAAERGCDPVDLLLQLAVETDFGVMFVDPVRKWKQEEVFEVMRHPRCVMTFSDSGAHVTQIMDSCIQTHLLAYWSRRRQALTLEEAVRMITLAPARAWGFADRGLLREGMAADINVFDPERIAPTLPQLVADLPTGARRLEQRAEGILATIVAGTPVIVSGKHTGALPGRLLRRGCLN